MMAKTWVHSIGLSLLTTNQVNSRSQESLEDQLMVPKEMDKAHPPTLTTEETITDTKVVISITELEERTETRGTTMELHTIA
jgi:hypothetical protein